MMNGNAGRPTILRADTIDLQDQDAPTAADHTKAVGTNGIAPHQASQYQNVQEERRSEEQTLATAWNMAGNSEDVNAAEQSDAETKQNGTNGEGAEDGEDTDAEGDDDMMDRISSSPSIDDGGFPSSPPVPGPVSHDHHTPQRAKLRLETSNQSPTSTLDSSPFLETPMHMPLGWHLPGQTSLHSGRQPATRKMSPSLHTPETSPLLTTATYGRFYSAASQRLRSEGRYAPDAKESQELDDEGFCEDATDLTTVGKNETSLNVLDPLEKQLAHHAGSVQRDSPRNSFSWRLLKPETSHLEQSPSLMSIASVNMQDVLLPEDDPMLKEECSPTLSEDSWESITSTGMEEDRADEDADAFLDHDDRFVDSGWGGECLRETEDIDFEFVYALHTFVATVEGQANATKGDTMVLLDDSNSYWWLVRVVKDSSIGYLPAEHIETPTERLARLNKHRNIDLSQAMLGDNPERSKNPLKKAMRRRNAKTVQFAAPTYVEASDYDYSSDEEQGMVDPYGSVMQQQQQEPAERGQPVEVEERNAPEEANVHATRRLSGEQSGAPGKASFESTGKSSLDSKRSSTEDPQLSPKLVDRSEAAPLKSRKGTPRNTDSFLKDDSIETRKISLTPGLLRDDSTSKNSSQESARNASMESLVKTPSPESERKNESEKKKKEKKQGMLSGLFKSKKKDKRQSSKDELKLVDADKSSLDGGRNSPRESPMASNDTSPTERVQTNPFAADFNKAASPQPAAKPNLSKTPPPIDTTKASSSREMPKNEGGGFVAELEGSQAAFEMGPSSNTNPSSQQAQPTTYLAPQETKKDGPLSPITNLMKPSEPKPKKAKRAKQRVELDDFDSPDSDRSPNPFLEQGEREESSDEEDRFSDSPVEITSPSSTFMHGTESVHIPLHVDEDEDENEHESDQPSAQSQAPDRNSEDSDSVIVDRPSPRSIDDDPTPTTTARQSPAPTAPPSRPAPQQPHSRETSTTSSHSSSPSSPHEVTTPTSTSPPQHPPITTATTTNISTASPSTSTASSQDWDDNNLRAWLEAEEVKDLLRIVHSKHAVEPVGPDHPSMKGLWEEPRKGVQGLMGELDGLLEGFLKGRGVVFT